MKERYVDWRVVILGLALIFAGAVPLMCPSHVCAGLALSVLWLLPAISWAIVLRYDRVATRIVFGAGLALLVSGLLTLLLVYLPGAFPVVLAPWIYGLVGVGLPFGIERLSGSQKCFKGIARSPSCSGSLDPDRAKLDLLRLSNRCRSAQPSDTTVKREEHSAWNLALVLVCVVAALFRFPMLGYSEFQGDEALIMGRAAQILAGERDQIFLHQKGPVEILMPVALWSLTETASEGLVRVPFALVGVLAVVAVACLGARWFDPRAGVLAGLLVAGNGFLLAFSRIVQYQNVVVAMGALSLLAMTHYAKKGRLRDIVLAAGFMAYGLLAHYDAILFAPAALWLLVQGLINQHMSVPRKKRVYEIAMAALLGLLILSAFYLPFVLNPNFAQTFSYLAEDRLGSGGLLHNNLAKVWKMSTFYNALYYVLALLLLVFVGAVGWVRSARAWLYFGVPFVFYLFLVFDPRTHVYTFYPGAAVLAAAFLTKVWDWLQDVSLRWRRLWMGVAVGWYILSAGYLALVFINHTPEYKREWPQSQHPLYPTTYKALPLFGFFGFPYRAGWKAVQGLYAQGVITGTYASNEEPEVTTWYVRDGARTLCNQPDLYIIAENVQDEIAVDEEELQRDYGLIAQILVEGRPKLHIYRRRVNAGSAASITDTLVVDAASYERSFDRGTTFAAQVPPRVIGAHPVGAQFGDVAYLVGYDISPLDETASTQVRPGDDLRITLYWEALEPTPYNYQVFTHLVAEGELIAQHDGAPACAHRPTSGWEPGMMIRDEHIVEIPSVREGSFHLPGRSVVRVGLYTGMYDLITLDRLPLNGGPENALLLQELTIVAP